MKNLLHIFRNRLLDLSSANRSVFLPKIYKGKFSDLKTWDFLSNASALDLVKALLRGTSSIKIADVKHVRPEELDLVLEEAKRLIRTARLIAEETGSTDFYVGWPFVEGVLKNGMPVRAPLIFLPYRLKQSGRELFLERQPGEEPFWNRSLFLSLQQFESYAFDANWLETPVPAWEDKTDRDFRMEILDALKQQGWQVAFDREFFSDNLSYFLPLAKADLLEQYTPGQYKLKPMAVMGLFPQSASYIHSDYEKLLTENEAGSAEDLLAAHYHTNEEGTVRALADFIPLPVDGAQEKIISEVAAGKSMVVQGPPGSGKTQLICNLIAQFIGKGKKVLVVCQKKAALDVIAERLRSIALDKFTALVHDAMADRKNVYEQLTGQIQSSEEYKKQNIHPDTILLEKEFSRVQSSIGRLSDFFSRYKQALYDTQLGGESAHHLYLSAVRNIPTVNLELEFQHIPIHEIEPRSHDFKQFIFYRQAIANDIERIQSVVPRELSIDDKDKMRMLLESIPQYLQKIRQWNESEQLMMAVDVSFAQEWLQKVRNWMNDALVYRHQVTEVQVAQFDPSKVYEWKQKVSKDFLLLNTLMSLPPDESVLEWQNKVDRTSKSGLQFLFFKLKAWIVGDPMVSWMRSNKLSPDREGLNVLKAVLEAVKDLKSIQKEWSSFAFLQVEHGLVERLFLQHLQTFDRIYEELKQADDIPALKTVWRSSINFKQRIEHLFQLVKERQEMLSSYFLYWYPKTVEQLFQEDAYRQEWVEFVRYRFERWLGYEQIKSHVSPALYHSFEKVFEKHDKAGEEELITTWKQSLYKHWIEEKERVFPILKTVSTPEWEMKEQELQVLTERRHSLSLEFLKIKLREWVYAGIQYNRLKRQVTYRDLLHQLLKKRNVWPLRKLMAQHEDEILNLIPCWLVSPETASMVFPMNGCFDLVIFDEASQCFVEKAFPSLFRGKQAVVIGDDRQLRPSDLYKVRYKADDEEEDPDQEVEALLDFSARHFPSDMLTGHYRSRSEMLIRFSNFHFYNNRLRVIPDIQYQREQALHYVKVDGRWQNNTNQEEAGKVVELVRQLQTSHPGKSIGIITFNYPQAFLINDMLEKSGMDLSSDFLIKNIENVQGDERDIIIFSIAYARNKEGRLVTQFGSLSMEGGENRLNVAITRAREKVIIVSSILPNELQVENHKNKGPELLKEYLHYVYESQRLEDRQGQVEEEGMLTEEMALNVQIASSSANRFGSSYFADLQSKDNHAQLIFTDDRRYFFSPSVIDWHSYTPQLFTRKGWNVMHAYSRNYWYDKALFFEKIYGTSNLK